MTQAEESLKKEAFSSAKEKYDLILENEPSDFEALKGLILCEIKAASLESLNTPGIFDTVDIVSLKNLITRLKKQASIKDSAFFDQLLNLIDLSDRLKIYQNSINSLYDEDTRAEIKVLRILSPENMRINNPLICLHLSSSLAVLSLQV